MPPILWFSLTPRTVIPGFHGRFIHSGRMTLVRWQIDKGAVLPRHRHPHEQVVTVWAGELEMVLDGQRHLLTSGSVLVIPPEAEHEAVALTDCDVMDVFAPVREDYLRDDGQTIIAAALE